MKDLKISRELIKAVLEKETETLSKDFNFTINEDYIEFSDDGEMQFEYCIYKFAFKCKDWMTAKGYYLCVFNDFGVDVCFCIIKWFNSENIIQNIKFIANTEIEVTIKACEWLLKERV